MKKVLVSITTITPNLWKKKVKEIDKLGLKEIALFPTCLNKRERKSLYKMLEKTQLERIPFVHMREEDMDEKELDYLTDRFKTKVFNLHLTKNSLALLKKLKKKKNKIFIENHDYLGKDYADMLKFCGGACLDISHWEDFGKKQKIKDYIDFEKIIKKTKIGCCHISIVKNNPSYFYDNLNNKKALVYHWHEFESLSDFNYIKKYKRYFNGYIALELENSLAEQLEAKKYIEKIIK